LVVSIASGLNGIIANTSDDDSRRFLLRSNVDRAVSWLDRKTAENVRLDPKYARTPAFAVDAKFNEGGLDNVSSPAHAALAEPSCVTPTLHDSPVNIWLDTGLRI
jgi:hypothetical protein